MATETSITRQAPYIEALGEQYGKDLTALTGKAMPTAGYAPTVAGQDPAQLAAYTQATTAGQGIGAYEPYLTQAGAYSGPTGYQDFMSPYQQDVIDKTYELSTGKFGKIIKGKTGKKNYIKALKYYHHRAQPKGKK